MKGAGNTREAALARALTMRQNAQAQERSSAPSLYYGYRLVTPEVYRPSPKACARCVHSWLKISSAATHLHCLSLLCWQAGVVVPKRRRAVEDGKTLLHG